MLEVKTGPRKYELCEKTVEILGDYPGDVCIESFDPLILRWFRKHAPQYLRGQLAQPAEGYEGYSKLLGFVLSHCLTNFMGRPHFIAYKLGRKALGARLAEAMGALQFGWTSRSLTDPKPRDGMIFEHYRPDLYL